MSQGKAFEKLRFPNLRSKFESSASEWGKTPLEYFSQTNAPHSGDPSGLLKRSQSQTDVINADNSAITRLQASQYEIPTTFQIKNVQMETVTAQSNSIIGQRSCPIGCLQYSTSLSGGPSAKPSINPLSTFSSEESHLNFLSYVESLIKTNIKPQTRIVRKRSFSWCPLRGTQNPSGTSNTSCSETEFSENGDFQDGGETYLKDKASKTYTPGNGTSVTTQFLITNSNTPLIND